MEKSKNRVAVLGRVGIGSLTLLTHLRHHQHEVEEDVVGDVLLLAQFEQGADVVLALLLGLGVDLALRGAFDVVSPAQL